MAREVIAGARGSMDMAHEVTAGARGMDEMARKVIACLFTCRAIPHAIFRQALTREIGKFLMWGFCLSLEGMSPIFYCGVALPG